MALLETSIPVPPGGSDDDMINGITYFYHVNFTEPGIPMMLGPIEVLAVALNGKFVLWMMYSLIGI